jgi:hypothetical protein
MKSVTKIILLALVTPLLFSCSNPDIPKVCTQQFVMHNLTVLSPGGEPADSVQIIVSNKATSDIYDVCGSSLCEETPADGQYIILHDGFFGKIDSDGETIVVHGEKGDRSFTEQFIFGDDGCHIQKIAGPDSVYLRVNKS